MTFKVGDKVRLAPSVTDEMLSSIYIEDDYDVARARRDSVVERAGDIVHFGGRLCDVCIGFVFVPSAWLVLVESAPPSLDVPTLRRIIDELNVSIGPSVDADLASARAYLKIAVERMERDAEDKQ